MHALVAAPNVNVNKVSQMALGTSGFPSTREPPRREVARSPLFGTLRVWKHWVKAYNTQTSTEPGNAVDAAA